MNYVTVVLEPSFVEAARAGKFPVATCPEWLKKGVFDFQHDSLQYRLEAGKPVNLPEDVGRHAARRATFLADHLVGPLIRPVAVTAVLPAGVQSAFSCPACGSDFADYKLLAQHILDAHAEAEDEPAGESGDSSGDVRPAASSPVGVGSR